ncbi:signal peptidase I [Orientia chuto str. Dubai]|uniref:Signal peptidase I n=1 Tax=Orientia chuto str. Dubai TaxID=1359168 RepID=A0A0F3MKH5_9RICK|nr:signal peptidase I [Candidatus Orientia mediorientalis]KJV56288.1 signal peptidase I [Orientia chuto str. Dubai]
MAEVRAFFKECGILILIGILVRIIIFDLNYIPSPSMVPNLLPGDYIFTTKYSYGYSKYSIPFNLPIFQGKIFASVPERGDVIVFQPPHDLSSEKYIKRLIGLPGDMIQIIDGQQIFINGVPLKREYIGKYLDKNGVEYEQYFEILPNNVKYLTQFLAKRSRNIGHIAVFNVPENHYFFLGDNRDNSADSRFDMGYVHLDNFVSKARFIWFSAAKKIWPESNNILHIVSNIIPWVKSVRYERFLQKI